MANTLVVTGGSRGIGKAVIERFLSKQWEVVNISRSECRLPGVKNISVDLSSLEDISAHAESIKQSVKGATTLCLVHNAGHYERDSIGNMSLAVLQQTFTVNVLASVALNEILIPLMNPSSSIIYIGSTLSEKAVPHAASYVISKHAVIGLMRATCQDLIDKSIRSVCICPGLVGTEMLKETMDEKVLQYLLTNKVMAKRLIEPSEIADVVYFTAIAPVLNNAVIHANLGQISD